MSCLLTRGHVLLEGIPGLGKTKIVQTLADVLNLKFNRIQFTPDLMPGDLIGTNVVRETEDGEKYLDFQQGPIFCNLMLADEVNRATPKSQSALLEAMQEKSVSVGNITHKLEEPFFVMATQNPIELEGTYPLPEAQMDRFLFKLKIEYPNVDEMHEIMERTTRVDKAAAKPVLEQGEVLEMRETVLSVPIAKPVQGLCDPFDARDPPELCARPSPHEQVRSLRRESPRHPGARSRRENAGAPERSRARIVRRYPRGRDARATSPNPSQLRG